jgi:hypothetical protein
MENEPVAPDEKPELIGEDQIPKFIATCFGCLQPIYNDQPWVVLMSPRLKKDGSMSPHFFHDLDACRPRTVGRSNESKDPGRGSLLGRVRSAEPSESVDAEDDAA